MELPFWSNKHGVSLCLSSGLLCHDIGPEQTSITSFISLLAVNVDLLTTLLWVVMPRSEPTHKAACDSVVTCHWWYKWVRYSRRCAYQEDRERDFFSVCMCTFMFASLSPGYVTFSPYTPSHAYPSRLTSISSTRHTPSGLTHAHVHTLYPFHNVIPFPLCIFFHLPPSHFRC